MTRDRHRSEADPAASQRRDEQELDRPCPEEHLTGRPGLVSAAIERVRVEDAELLDRLSR